MVVVNEQPTTDCTVRERKGDGWLRDLERVDGALVRGGELLAVGERERGCAARPGGDLETPGAQLPALPALHLPPPHPISSPRRSDSTGWRASSDGIGGCCAARAPAALSCSAWKLPPNSADPLEEGFDLDSVE
jgi:hypothetical protein